LVTSTLIGSGHAPRQVIGSVNAAEFFIIPLQLSRTWGDIDGSICQCRPAIRL
jgi:hypothetical protein